MLTLPMLLSLVIYGLKVLPKDQQHVKLELTTDLAGAEVEVGAKQ